jgi:hypothetical protein
MTVEAVEQAGKQTRVEAEVVSPTRIALRTENARAIRIDTRGLTAQDKPVTFTLNGATVCHERVPNNGRMTVVHAGSSWSCRATAGATLRKTAQLLGPIADAFNSPFLFVCGSGGAMIAAEAQIRDWMARANGIVTLKNASAVTPADIRTRNLVLFGTAETNSLIGGMAADLPVQFVGRSLRVRGRDFVGKDIGTAFVAPNPLNPAKYVVLVSGTSALSYRLAGRLPLLELPDYVVFDSTFSEGTPDQFVTAGFWDDSWGTTRPSY